MNFMSIVGFIIASAVLFMGFKLASDDLNLFLDGPSAFIVLGGTFASTAISFQINRFFTLIKIFIVKVIKSRKYKYKDTIVEMMQISDSYRKGTSFKALSENAKDPFLRDSLILLEDAVLSPEESIELITTRNDNQTANYVEDANKMKTVGKYPPAFGMIGTTIGMIVLLANLGGEDAMKMIGPAMGVCLITTLYGSVVANLFFLPVSDNLMDGAKEMHLKNKIIIEGMRLTIKKTSPIIVAEKLNAFLNPSDRLDWKEMINK